MFLKLFAILAVTLLSHSAIAEDKVAERFDRNADFVGEARMKVYFWNVFDASLYATSGAFNPSEPFALSLSYLRKLQGDKIVSKTIEEMQAQQKFTPQELAGWSDQLSLLIDDVDSGTTITGARDDQGHTLFYRNGQRVGEIADPRFTEGFFNIWLGPKTSEPQLRNKLLNQ